MEEKSLDFDIEAQIHMQPNNSSSSPESHTLKMVMSPSVLKTSKNHETPSATTAANQNPDDQQASHPVFEILREEQLGRHILVLAIPMTIGLFPLYHNIINITGLLFILRLTALTLALGVVLIWNGILLRRTFKESSQWIELSGVALLLFAFFGFVGCFLPAALAFVPWLCWFLSLLPFIIGFCFRKKAAEHGEAQDSNPPPHVR